MNLVIVESPHKAETIQKFLGKDYKVVPSKGHIRDLQEKELGVDIENGFKPNYVVPAEKKKTVSELKALAAKADMVYLASDEDREGEAISWHLADTLGLDPSKTKRITFHEITKTAIDNALLHPRGVDMNLVNAQQARRILDRLVGYELSPVLWRKIKRGLSAGRVQSVALRLVTDREKEILAFKPQAYYKVEASFEAGRRKVKGSLDKKFETTDDARKFLQDCIGAEYSVASVEKKEGVRLPAAPFTTSTLQQEAGRKLHFSVSLTMSIAQRLYEKGLITYMRTDSTNLSSLAINTAKAYICENFGEHYSHPRQFKTKSKGAQEAHEAIRPTYLNRPEIEGTAQEQKLYKLIFNRTLASQMAEAKVLNTNIKVGISTRSEQYVLQSAEVLFDGFLRLYIEGTDDAAEEELGLLPNMEVGTKLQAKSIDALCRFTAAPFRFSEPTLVKRLEELGIGRPSTYAPIISTLTTGRGYLVKGDKAGEEREVLNLRLKQNELSEIPTKETIGAEKGKLLPTEIGMVVSDYLVDNFADILDYGFTADVENDFDRIAEGKLDWHNCLGSFYTPFHQEVSSALNEQQYRKVERVIGVDPQDGQSVVARLGQYGPYVQKGEGESRRIARLEAGQLIESLTLDDALALFRLPRTVGQWNGMDVIANKGRFGPYLKYGNDNVSLPKGCDPASVSIEQCIAVIEADLKKKAQPKTIAEWEGIQIINGMYGPYIKTPDGNFRIPKGTDAGSLTEQDCKAIIASGKPSGRKSKKK